MPRTNFEKLEVYRLAESLADQVWDIVRAWDGFAKATVGKQLVRSVDSVAANVAEGSGRSGVKDRRHFVRMARGSLYESKNWLRRAYRRQLLDEEQVASLKPLLEALAPMLNAYLRAIGSGPQEQKSKL